MGGEGRASVHDTTYDPLVEEPLPGGAHNSLRVPRPDPPLLPSIIFPLGHARAFITTMVTNYVNTKLFLHVDSILALTMPRNVKHPR